MKRFRFHLLTGLIGLLGLLSSATVQALPAQIFLIRHAEKPPKGIHLDTRGRERAAALVPYFLETPELLKQGPPAAIYAMKQAKSSTSVRPIETVEPLAEALDQEVIAEYTREDYLPMVNEILSNPDYDGKTVLISWGHAVLGEMAHAFGAKKAPKEWPSAYDRVWVITYKQDGKVEFKDVPQKLLYGDDKK